LNPSALVALLSAFISLLAAGLSHRLSRNPTLAGLRWFTLAALCSAAYAVGCHLATLQVGDDVILWASRVQMASAVVLLWGWIRFSQEFVGARPGPAERAAAWALLGAVVLPLVPGAVFDGRIVERASSALQVAYREAHTTLLGDAVAVLLLLVAIFVLARFARAWRAGTRHARALTLGSGFLVALGVNDVLVVLQVTDAPYLVGVGLAGPLAALAWSFTARFVESARALERLHAELEERVEERTRELAVALGALHGSERLAALGQFAAGVAHEVNSPAAAVIANLRYLQETSDDGEFPPDARAVITDALEAMQRINGLVRKLVDAGRIATPGRALSPVPVGRVVERVLEEARARHPERIVFVGHVPETIFARSQPEALERVLAALVANAAEAVPDGRGGRVEVRAERTGVTARITVSDDGVGMGAEQLRRACDPFFSTKGERRAQGLGLSVARGLVEGHGGVLRLRSAPGAGTTAIVDLPEAPIPTPAPFPAS